MVVVVDASVLAKLFLKEVGSEEAEKLVIINRVILAPDIARIEVASAITRAYRKNSITFDEAKKRLAEWQQILALGNIRLASTTSLQQKAEELSLQIRHALADCFYLALAVENSIPLITADKPFLDSANPHFADVRHLFGSIT